MAGRATDLWDERQYRTRRFTLLDLMTIVAWIAVLCAAMSGALGSDLSADRKALVFALAVACPALCGLLWFLSGLEFARWRWLNGLLGLLIVVLTVIDSLLFLALGYVHPATAGLTCVTLSALIVYLASWVQ
jgi:hypothetical protein